ncbi:MAG: hypothetical protein H7126_06410 [Candidatus Parcubacteria bacterium]|uniref:hypothetical protein n=1 Tax=Phormidesmis priestleyi TaxID=268141 RepID=UPI0012E985DA|nr:hypothetical protein [Phormidesmis priestleyi]MBC7823498.1 hypothetical protein [Leptolyngbyaceae cyanobacterium LF-bin-113]
MPTFEPQKPIVTATPIVVVDAGLAPGRYRFQLVVEDDTGNQSQPTEQIVVINPSRIR